MFSGIIEYIGKVDKIEKINGGLSLNISAKNIFNDLKIGDSVSVDGVCLTVTSFNENYFTADAVGETLNKTTIGNLKLNSRVNLERAIQYNQRIGGHLVQGHINSTTKISSIQKLGENYALEVVLPDNLMKYVINEGSIAVNGISLTVAEINGNKITISVIPHTWNNTTLQFKKQNDLVNIEVDLLAKYIEKMLFGKDKNNNKNISTDWLKNLGY